MPISLDYAFFIKSALEKSYGVTLTPYSADDLDNDVGSDGRGVLTNMQYSSFFNNRTFQNQNGGFIPTIPNIAGYKMTAVYRENRTVFLNMFNLSTPKIYYYDGTITSLTSTLTLKGGVNIKFSEIGNNIYTPGMSSSYIGMIYTIAGLNGGFWLMRYISGGSTGTMTYSATNGPGTCITSITPVANAKIVVEFVKIDPVTSNVLKRVRSTLFTDTIIMGGHMENSASNGFEMPGCLVVHIGGTTYEIIDIDTGISKAVIKIPLIAGTHYDNNGNTLAWSYTQKMIFGDAGDLTSDSWITYKVDDWNMIDFPEPPTGLYTGGSSITPNQQITVSFNAPAVPVQQHGASPDSEVIRYHLEMFVDNTWTTLLKDFTSTSVNIQIPANTPLGTVSFRVSSGYLWKGTSLYDEKYATVPNVNVISNNIPTSPTFVTNLSGQVLNALEKLTVDFTDSTDVDVVDILKYDVEFSTDGLSWFVLFTQLTKSEFMFSVPLVSSTTARLRIRSSDGKSYSGYTTSGPFTISAPDLNKQLPNAISLTNNESFVETDNNLIPSSGEFTLEFSFKIDSTRATERYIFSSKGTLGNSISVFLNTFHRLTLSIGTGADLSSSIPFNDGKIHYGAVIRRAGVLELVVDGASVGTLGVPTMESVGGSKLYIGRHPDYNTPFLGTIGMMRVWTGKKTIAEIEAMKNAITIGTEPALYNFLMFDATTGLLKLGKSPFTVASMRGDIQWAYRFLPLSEVTLPFPDQTLKKENIEYMRDVVNKFRKANGFPNSPWTDETVIAGVTPVKADHWNEIQQAIDTVYTSIGQAIQTATVNKGTQIEDVRPSGTSTVTAPVTVSIKDVIEPKKSTFKVNELQYRMLMLMKILRGN